MNNREDDHIALHYNIGENVYGFGKVNAKEFYITDSALVYAEHGLANDSELVSRVDSATPYATKVRHQQFKMKSIRMTYSSKWVAVSTEDDIIKIFSLASNKFNLTVEINCALSSSDSNFSSISCIRLCGDLLALGLRNHALVINISHIAAMRQRFMTLESLTNQFRMHSLHSDDISCIQVLHLKNEHLIISSCDAGLVIVARHADMDTIDYKLLSNPSYQNDPTLDSRDQNAMIACFNLENGIADMCIDSSSDDHITVNTVSHDGLLSVLQLRGDDLSPVSMNTAYIASNLKADGNTVQFLGFSMIGEPLAIVNVNDENIVLAKLTDVEYKRIALPGIHMCTVTPGILFFLGDNGKIYRYSR